MLRPLRLTVLALTVLTALSLAAPEFPIQPRPAAAQPPPPITRLVVFAPGIDAQEITTTPCPPVASGCYDPYARAALTFQPILTALGCAPAPAAGKPYILCANGIVWAPFSYAGVGGSAILPYTGTQTAQSLQTSAAAMTSLVAFLRGFPELATVPLAVVGHSLGGAVATFWGSTNTAVPVVTLDSPVNGIWSFDPAELLIYCNSSVGLFATSLQRDGCLLLSLLPAVKSPVFNDLHNPAVIARMGSANAFNFANIADVFVPTWFAVNTSPRIGAGLVNSSCTSQGDPFGLNHDCVIAAAAGAVANFANTGVFPSPTPVRSTITLSISAFNGSTPIDGSVTALHVGQVVAGTPMRGGRASLVVPWQDLVLQLTYPGGIISLGVLPGANTDLAIDLSPTVAAPAKTCTPANPLPGGSTTCTVTLASPLQAQGSIVDTVTGPAGATITACGAATGGLNCSPLSAQAVSINCSPLMPATTCPAGATFSITITSATAGALTESLLFQQPAGTLPAQTFTVVPNPAVVFGAPTAKSCSVTSPPVGASTVCTITLGAPVPGGTTLTDTVTGPAGATITACGGATGGLSCGRPAPTAVTVTCAVAPAASCPAGATFDVTITSSTAGALTETLTVTPPSGPPQNVNLTPSPPVTFVAAMTVGR